MPTSCPTDINTSVGLDRVGRNSEPNMSTEITSYSRRLLARSVGFTLPDRSADTISFFCSMPRIFLPMVFILFFTLLLNWLYIVSAPIIHGFCQVMDLHM